MTTQSKPKLTRSEVAAMIKANEDYQDVKDTNGSAYAETTLKTRGAIDDYHQYVLGENVYDTLSIVEDVVAAADEYAFNIYDVLELMGVMEGDK